MSVLKVDFVVLEKVGIVEVVCVESGDDGGSVSNNIRKRRSEVRSMNCLQFHDQKEKI